MSQATPYTVPSPPQPSRAYRVLTTAIVAAVVGLTAVYLAGPESSAVFHYRAEVQNFINRHFAAGLIFFCLIQTILLGCSVPIGATLNLIGGFLFGRWWGWLAISLGTGTGALLAFLIIRHLARDWFRRQVARRPRLAAFAARFERGLESHGAAYLALVRLTPVVPYFLTNALFAITPMRARTFWWVSQVSMIPVMFIYANAGAQLGEVRSTADLFSADLALSLSLVAAFPWLTYGLARLWRGRSRSPGSLPPV